MLLAAGRWVLAAVWLPFFTLINSTKVSGPSFVQSFPLTATAIATAVKGSIHYSDVYVY